MDAGCRAPHRVTLRHANPVCIPSARHICCWLAPASLHLACHNYPNCFEQTLLAEWLWPFAHAHVQRFCDVHYDLFVVAEQRADCSCWKATRMAHPGALAMPALFLLLLPLLSRHGPPCMAQAEMVLGQHAAVQDSAASSQQQVAEEGVGHVPDLGVHAVALDAGLTTTAATGNHLGSQTHVASEAALGSQLADAADLTSQDKPDAGNQAAGVADLDDIGIKYNMTIMTTQLYEALLLLYGESEQGQDVGAALQQLQELANVLDEVLPMTTAQRQRQHTPGAVQHTAGNSTDMPKEGLTGSGAAGNSSSSISDEAAAAGIGLLADNTQHASITKYQNTGVRVAAEAAFVLTALHHAGILPDSMVPASVRQAGGKLPVGETLMQLHRQAQVGSTQALLSLADRYFSGIGVQRDCWIGARYARLAALAVAAEVEKEGRYLPSLQPAELRERHMDAKFVTSEELENAAHVVHMDEDMAIRGSVDAQRRMAYRRLMGRGIDADPEGAFQDFQAGAAQGDPFAIFNLGYMYVRGLHVNQDYEKAILLFKQAADKGFGPAWNGLGVMAWGGQGGPVNMTLAVEMFQKGAALNQSDSLYNLGLMYLYNTAVELNNTKAAELFMQADEGGHWRAALDVASMYEEGVGLPKDCGKAEQYYRKYLRERTHWTELMDQAYDYVLMGDDWTASVVYLLLAEQGSHMAAANAAFLLRQGRGYTGPGYLDLAAQLYERAALQNHTSSAVELGHMLLEAEQLQLGSYKADASAAVAWWEAAAAHNSSEAWFLLGWAHHTGKGVEGGVANATKAHACYKASIQAAGAASWTRGLSGHLGLAVLQLDDLLQAFAGPQAFTRFCVWLRDHAVQSQWVRPPPTQDMAVQGSVLTEGVEATSTDSHSVGDENGTFKLVRDMLSGNLQAIEADLRAAKGALAKELRALEATWYEAGLDGNDLETFILASALWMLLVVLVVRRVVAYRAWQRAMRSP